MDVRQPSINWDADNLDKEWTKFENHAKLMFDGPFAGKVEKVQCPYLLIWVADRGRELFKIFDITETDKEKVIPYLKSFEIMLHQNETKSSYGIPVKTSGYNNVSEMIRDKIGKKAITRDKLLAEGDGLTLERAIKICHTYETTQAQLKMFEEKQEIKQELDAVSRNWKRVCKTKAVNFVEDLHSEHSTSGEPPGNSNSGEESDLYPCSVNRNDSKYEAYASLCINEQIKKDFKVETGAKANQILQHNLEILCPKPTIQTTNHRLTSYCGSQILSLETSRMQ
ncbi:hypothetical protein QYM36_013635, partial [Artemia franciscana]